jgi:hypothetical protein
LNLEAYFKLALEGIIALLTDFHNAFDTLDHEWIFHVLERAKFGNFFINAVKFLLTDMKAYPIVGNSHTNHGFDILAGVRQGDPISGLLFVICIEPLLRAAAPLCSKILPYADDLVFITRNSNETIQLIKLVKDFESVSGLKLNPMKSKLVEFGNPFNDSQILGISFVKSFEYLGYLFDSEGIDQSFLMKKLDDIVDLLNRCKKLNLAISQKVTILNTYAFSQLYYFLWATTPTEPFYKEVNKIMRWFLNNSKFPYDRSRTYPLHMALSIFQKPKAFGGFDLISLRAKSFAMKWMLLERYRNVDCPFRTLLFSTLTLARKTKGNVLAEAKKIPQAATGFARDLIQTAMLIKPVFQATNLQSVFSDSAITYPDVTEIKSNGTTVKDLSRRILNSVQPFSSLRDGQKKLCAICPIDWNTIWQKLRSLKGLRPAVRSFLCRFLNAGIYLPISCPVCDGKVDCSTVHFIQCPVINSLTPNDDVQSFLEDPVAATRRSPHFPLLLFAAYATLMDSHFNPKGDPHVDFISRVKLRLDNEIQRRDAYIF